VALHARRQRFSALGPTAYINDMLKRSPFIVPSAPVKKQQPPFGPQWLHEVKFDGWRVQLHKNADDVTIFSRNGHDYTRRFPAIHDSVLSLPARSAIIDAEIVVCDSEDVPDFKALMEGRTTDLCSWCFDILELKGCDGEPKPAAPALPTAGILIPPPGH
jgi:bifunctional non-homologous end joining protein LigD